MTPHAPSAINGWSVAGARLKDVTLRLWKLRGSEAPGVEWVGEESEDAFGKNS